MSMMAVYQMADDKKIKELLNMPQDEILAEWEKLQENEEGYLEIGELWDG